MHARRARESRARAGSHSTDTVPTDDNIMPKSTISKRPRKVIKMARGPVVPKAVCVLILHQGAVLTIKHHGDDRALDIGGRIDDGESIQDAVARVLLREVGLDAAALQKVGQYFSYHCRAVVVVLKAQDGDLAAIAVTHGESVASHQWRRPQLAPVAHARDMMFVDDGTVAHFRLSQSIRLGRHVLQANDDQPEFQGL